MYCENPSSMLRTSGLPSGPVWPVTTRPPYSFATNALYDAGSLKMLALVMSLFGASGMSLQAAIAASATSVVMTRVFVDLDMGVSLLVAVGCARRAPSGAHQRSESE